MDISTLVQRLDSAVPGFASFVESDDNLFSSDTAHGVFAGCSDFVQDRKVSIQSWTALAELLNEAVGGSDEDMDNAACTCFLENLAAKTHPLGPFLRGEALMHWNRWCDPA